MATKRRSGRGQGRQHEDTADIADRLVADHWRPIRWWPEATMAGPRLRQSAPDDGAWRDLLQEIMREAEAYGRRHRRAGGSGSTSNTSPPTPTGPRSISAIARGAVVGDALANLLTQGRLCGPQGILHQRRRQPGGRPRLGRLLALSAGDRNPPHRGGIRRRSAGRLQYRGEYYLIPDRHRTRRPARRDARDRPTRASPPPRTGCRSCASSRLRRVGIDPHRPRHPRRLPGGVLLRARLSPKPAHPTG